jgi:hypothetical protein
MAQGASFGAEINWPLVAGLGVAAAVLFYALYIANNQLQAADSAVASIGNIPSSIGNWISGLFSGDSDQ